MAGIFLILALLVRGAFAQAPNAVQEAQRAQQLAAAGKLEEAIRIYRDLVRNSPDNPILLLNLTVAEYTAKHYHEAIDHATAALKLQPDLLAARLFLGASHLQLGQFTPAIDSLKLVVGASPGERNGRLMLGEALLGAGQPAAAVEHLHLAAEALPNNPRAWYELGLGEEALGNSAAAKEAWQRLMALPASAESHIHAAETHQAEQRWRAAALEWREALGLAPDRASARVGLAWALFRTRDYRTAMSELKPLEKSENAKVQFLLGASLLNLQEPVEAIPYLTAAVQRDDRMLPAHAGLGQALLQTGKIEQAIPELKSAIPVDQDGSTRFQLFRAYQLLHREAEARQALADYQRFRASLAARP